MSIDFFSIVLCILFSNYLDSHLAKYVSANVKKQQQLTSSTKAWLAAQLLCESSDAGRQKALPLCTPRGGMITVADYLVCPVYCKHTVEFSHCLPSHGFCPSRLNAALYLAAV